MARSRSEAKEAALRCGLLDKSRSDQLLSSSSTMCALAESVQVCVWLGRQCFVWTVKRCHCQGRKVCCVECSRMPEFRVSWGHSRNWLSQVIERVVRIRQRQRRMISESRSTRPPSLCRLCNLITRLKATLSELTEQTNAFLQSLFLCRKLSPAYIRPGQSHKIYLVGHKTGPNIVVKLVAKRQFVYS